MTLYNPGGKPQVFMSSVVVHNAAAPVAWTDLDLTGTMGAVDGVVLLLVTKTAHTVATDYQFRPDGIAKLEGPEDIGYIKNMAANGRMGFVVMKAIAGIVEWISNAADAVTVTLLAYAVG